MKQTVFRKCWDHKVVLKCDPVLKNQILNCVHLSVNLPLKASKVRQRIKLNKQHRENQKKQQMGQGGSSGED